MTEEGKLQRDIRVALGRHPSLYLMRNQVGKLFLPSKGQLLQFGRATVESLQRYFRVQFSEHPRNITYGLEVGSSDLVGILKPSGRWFCLEVKTPTGRVSPEQEKWMALMVKFGAYCAVVRSVEEAERALAEALAS